MSNVSLFSTIRVGYRFLSTLFFIFCSVQKHLGLCLTFENYFWANLLKVWCGEFVYTSNFQYVGFRIKCLRRGQQKHVVFLVYLNSSSHVFLNMDLIIPVANNSYQTKTSPPDTHHFFTPQMILEGKTILCTIVSIVTNLCLIEIETKNLLR